MLTRPSAHVNGRESARTGVPLDAVLASQVAQSGGFRAFCGGPPALFAAIADESRAFAAGRRALQLWDEDEAHAIARTLNEDRRAMPRAERLEVVKALRDEGHSTRAIAGAVGVDHSTVVRDLSGGASAPPAQVTGTDGKSYPAARVPESAGVHTGTPDRATGLGGGSHPGRPPVGIMVARLGIQPRISSRTSPAVMGPSPAVDDSLAGLPFQPRCEAGAGFHVMRATKLTTRPAPGRNGCPARSRGTPGQVGPTAGLVAPFPAKVGPCSGGPRRPSAPRAAARSGRRPA